MLEEEQKLERVFTQREAARILNVVERTIRRRIDAGDLEAYKEGNQWRITETSLLQYQQKQRKKYGSRAA